jgi:hypothetical protein
MEQYREYLIELEHRLRSREKSIFYRCKTSCVENAMDEAEKEHPDYITSSCWVECSEGE